MDEFKIEGPHYSIVFERDNLGLIIINAFNEYCDEVALVYPSIEDQIGLVNWLNKGSQ